MPLAIDMPGELVETAYLVEDLALMVPLFRAAAEAGRPLQPSAAVLRHLGEAYIEGGPAGPVARAGGLPAIIDSDLVPVLGGAVRLSYFLMAMVLGRPGLRALFQRERGFDWDGALRWLVLHGIREMPVWPALPEDFVRALRAPSLRRDGRRVSPLQAIVMADRADVAEAFRRETPDDFAAAFAGWVLRRGLAENGLAWLMTPAELAAKLAEDPGAAWATPAFAAAPPDAAFPDPPPDAPPAGDRPRWRRHGPRFPATFLDLTLPESAQAAVAAGEARPAPRGGLDLAGAGVALRLPDAGAAPVLLRLDLAVPDPLRADLALRITLRDASGAACFARSLSATALGAAALTVPLPAGDLARRLEIAFALRGAPPDPDLACATLGSLLVWRAVG